ncbi:MAG: hypothetical protein GXP25_20705 [Planctomycetes bacterium]|nr:hypothetical protein [Planctomycetota bacterium]
MQEQLLTTTDWVVVVIYMIIMMGAGLFAKTLIKTPEDYFAAGHRMPWWLASISHHMSGYSAFAFVAYAGFAYKAGLTTWVVFAVPCAVGVAICAFVWAPRWARLTVLTPVEYLEQRFNNLTRQTVAWSGIFLKFMDEGAKFFSLALAVNVCTGWRMDAIIIVSGVIAVAYVLLGGLWADAISDFMQFIVQFAVTLLLVPLVWSAVGGWSGLWSNPKAPPFGLTNAEWPIEKLLIYGIVVTLSYSGGTWGLAQRFYSLKRPEEARKAALLSSALYLFYPLVILIPVWAARIVLPPLDDPNQAYILMVDKFIAPIMPGLLGLFICSMFAATMSMVDSDINALAAVFTKDIYQRQFDRNASEGRLLIVGLLATTVLGAVTVGCALAILWDPRLKGPFETMVKYFAGLLTPISIPLLFGMLNRRATWRGAVGAVVGGLATWGLVEFVLYPRCISHIYSGPAASWVSATGAEMIVAFGIFFLDGFISKQTPEEKARVDALFDQLSGKTGRKSEEEEA